MRRPDGEWRGEQQPVCLAGLPFQVPLPVTASGGSPRLGDGHIDVLARLGRGGKGLRVYVSNSCVNPIVRNNLVWGNAANGIHMNGDLSQGGNGLIVNALVEKNVIYDNGRQGGSGINADGVQSSRFLNNVLYNNHASGISLYRSTGRMGRRTTSSPTTRS
jgi:parallel beta-helix repeat protein